MKIAPKEMAKAIYELAEENPKNISKITKEFYLYLLKQKKIKTLPFIYEELEKILKEKEGATEIEVEAARSLTDGQKERIKSVFKNEKVIIKEKVDPNLVAGIVLKIDDHIIDGSLRTNLQKLKEAMWQMPAK